MKKIVLRVNGCEKLFVYVDGDDVEVQSGAEPFHHRGRRTSLSVEIPQAPLPPLNVNIDLSVDAVEEM